MKSLLSMWLGAVLVASAGGEGLGPLRWGDCVYFAKWDRPGYEIDSDYPFLTEMPTLEKFPELLKLGEGEFSDGDRRILTQQMIALSRCDFIKPLKEGKDGEKFKAALPRWKEWWEYFGKQQAEALPKEGKTCPKAWKQINLSPYLPCPVYPVLLPETWSFKLTYQSGDYLGVVTETIRMERAGGKASLTRRYQTRSDAPWVNEIWEGLTEEDAESFLAMLVYAVDHPWLNADEKVGKSIEDSEIAQINKRPEAWHIYNAWVKWTGILDAQGRVTLNDDPVTWETQNSSLCQDAGIDEGIGVVYRLILEHFPDPSYDNSLSRWKKVEGEEKKE